MPISNHVKSDSLLSTYTYEAYNLGSLRCQLADEVNGIDLAADDGTPAFTVQTSSADNLQKGERVWVFVKAQSAVAAGDLCKVDTTAAGTPFTVAPDAGSETGRHLLRGVAQSAIAAGEYGWIVQSGPVVVQAEAGVAAGDALASDGDNTAGEVDTFTFTPGTTSWGSIVGVAMDAEAAGSRYGTGFCQAMIDLS